MFSLPDFQPPTRDAAFTAFAILAHPAAPILPAAAADCLELIRDRRQRNASSVEWALLRNCRDLLLRAERRDV